MVRVTVLATYSNNCQTLYGSLIGFGCTLHIINYYRYGPSDFQWLLPEIVQSNPDWILFISTIEKPSSVVPPLSILSQIGEKYPLVHLCGDGSEREFWPQLQRYCDSGSFALQINCDGVAEGPISINGLTTLTPLDPNWFQPKDWNNRSIELGFCGSWQVLGVEEDHPRGILIDKLIKLGMLHVRQMDYGTADEYRSFLSSCKCVFNHAATGTADRMHVKGRVVEAAHAGSVLIENEGSPTSKWFEPGVDYLTYSSIEDIREKVSWVNSNLSKAREMAHSMRSKALVYCSPASIWGKVVVQVADWRGSVNAH